MEYKARILLVEDDEGLGQVIMDSLRHAGYEVLHCTDGERGWQYFQKKTFDLVLLDLVLPKKDGFTLLHQIRNKNKDIPLLILTASSGEEEKAVGFRSGADDYITKPFSMQELCFRIEVFLRRSKPLQPAQHARFNLGDLCFDYSEMVLIGPEGPPNNLTQKEAELLKFFCEHANKILRREDILREVWGKEDYFLGRSLDVFITKLRKRLRSEPEIDLETIHGVGFKFNMT
ncbi:MAG TPA: response regulator transcription factor [Chitinophagaceae bacterium]|nr:response regulator transcription factor [Chitinophagaceae bacterium]